MTSILPGGRELKVAGVPLRVSPLFVVLAVFAAWHATRDVARTSVTSAPAPPPVTDWREYATWLDSHEAFVHTFTRPSLGWVLAAGLAVAAVYTLSVLLHELGHLHAARAVGVDVAAVELDFAGGFVELDDDDRLTAGRLALIVAAGPLATAGVLLASVVALRLLGSDVSDAAHPSGASVVIDRVLSSAVFLNAVALAVNLLPFRRLDGGQLLGAARLWHSRGRGMRTGA
jgi:Zn-dependent protease